MTRNLNISIALILISLSYASLRLVVYGPQELKEAFAYNDFKIPASYANFGNIPYGQSLIGRIYYNSSNPDGCTLSNFTNDFSGDPDGILTPIFLVKRGHCSFVTKVRNIQKAGGSLAVIIDDTTEDISKVIMSDDGTGSGIRIPAMLIGNKDGQALMSFLMDQPQNVSSQASLQAEFIMQNHDNFVKWQLWYTSTSDRALDFIKNFKDIQEELQDDVEFEPRIALWSCPSCDQTFRDKECFSNGKYCAMNHQGTYIQGKDILMEDLRQKCLFSLTKANEQEDQWWTYMKYVHSMCYEEINEECSKLGHKDIGRNYEDTMACVAKSFSGTNYQKDDNSILREELAQWKLYGSAYWPAIVINDRTYRGDMVPDNVLNALCSGFIEEPPYCKRFKEEEGLSTPEGITGNILIVVVIFLIIVNVVLIMIYRRCANKELKDDMHLQVNSAVSQYFALSTKNTPNQP